MSYKGWKMMDKVDVAIKTSPDNTYSGRTFNAFVVEHGDKNALETAKKWATEREYDYDKKEYTQTHEPEIHTFDNEGFTVKILKSAGGSSQGGRLSFLACEIEKDGIKFVIGVNDGLLVDLIRNSEISQGVIKEKVMFVRKGGQPGFIHDGMEAYKEANADMKLKSDLKKSKKTSKWEIGGIYNTLTHSDICLGEVWDTMEEHSYQKDGWPRSWRTKLQKREKPIKVTAWTRVGTWKHKDGYQGTFNDFLKEEIGDGTHIWFSTGKPPARAKAHQLEVTEEDLKLIDNLLSLRGDYTYDYGDPEIKGRFVRELR